MRAHVELSSKAGRDLKRLGSGPDRKAVIDALNVGLAAIPQPGNLDIKALEGAAPWLRLRVGDYRIVYRPLDRSEASSLAVRRNLPTVSEGYLVARIVHRRELERAVASLL
ncbi:MAG TPA: type II toxin-antitoxin system RelE/ParE family toxin [Actinomycetes bacterium]|jgi:mRNA-degrading endonuclease RelE of RelBE toxin-antitoxin system|nr:type II toxin-antitoxin system RelE/ParE family toxin [Actinomycetes bacterium]